MPRYKLLIEYDGTPFLGWQRQRDGASVQGALEAALEAAGNGPSIVQGAGRTDAGVHARGQVAHCDTPKDGGPERLLGALNAHLAPLPVVVLAVERVAEDFHARFDATKRAYRYRILNRRVRPALQRGQVWWVPRPLDAQAMHRAAQALVGRHDFTTYRAAACQVKSPVKTVDAISVIREGDEVLLDVRARSFLHNQIRSFAGSLKLVGEGRWNEDEIAAALTARDRSRCGPLAPPDGLYLTEVGYAPRPSDRALDEADQDEAEHEVEKRDAEGRHGAGA